jgi:dTDP-4-dehydrorhamnose reductase
MRILITGSNGLLGQKIVAQCLNRGHVFLATSKGDNRNPDCSDNVYASMDICSEEEIRDVFNVFNPTHVIHTAALTNVDYCELNPEECNEVNVQAVAKLWASCRDRNIHFQLLSTDFVFDGEKGNYVETDPVGPLSIYAQSKVDAEQILLKDALSSWSIVRTIIVYGDGHNLSRSNIVLWAKDALSEGKELSIVDDQFRAPTWADDLAWACLEICLRNREGIYHICGPETISVYEIVMRIGAHFGFSTEKISRSSSSTLNQTAKRPPKTGFDLSKARVDLGYEPKNLESTLDLL